MYKLVVIFACYEVLLEMKKSNHNDFFIMTHQHDGISIELKEGANKEAVINRLKVAVLKRGYEYNMKMILED